MHFFLWTSVSKVCIHMLYWYGLTSVNMMPYVVIVIVITNMQLENMCVTTECQEVGFTPEDITTSIRNPNEPQYGMTNLLFWVLPCLQGPTVIYWGVGDNPGNPCCMMSTSSPNLEALPCSQLSAALLVAHCPLPTKGAWNKYNTHLSTQPPKCHSHLCHLDST